ncbi:DNA polymerase alpha catalytic subunit [Nymphon striatum]|nr:DNA polymerase alpha catalytic subunit [Nymphon striatum]
MSPACTNVWVRDLDNYRYPIEKIDGSGYVEDGREVFDDFEGNEVTENKGKSKQLRKFGNPNIGKKNVTSRGKDIKSMFMAMPASKKKSDKEAKLEDDDLLGNIMEELKSEPDNPKMIKEVAPKKHSNPFRSSAASTCTTPIRNSKIRKTISARSINYDSDDIKSSNSQSLQIKEFDNGCIMKEETSQSENVEASDSEAVDMWSDDVSESALADFAENVDKNEDKPKQKEGFITKSDEDEVKLEWNASQKYTDLPSAADVQLDSSKLPLTKIESGENVLKFYWIDAYEDFKKQSGMIYLFGKVYIESAKVHVSCCINVRNINRQIFVLPRTMRLADKEGNDPVTIKDVYMEFNEKVLNQYKIKSFKSRKVNKGYAFGISGIPEQSDYLEFQYSAEFPSLPMTLSGDTFSHVFGTNTSSLESFLLDRKMKGPCWLEIKCSELPKASFSWCKIEAVVQNPNNISVIQNPLAAPPLVVMAMSMPTAVNPKTMQSEIVAVSCLIHEQFYINKPAPNPPYNIHFCALTKPADTIYPYDLSKVLAVQKITKIEKIDSERALLGYLLARIQRHDPDILIGHDVVGFDLDILIHRLEARKVPNWSRIGRLKRTNIPRLPPSVRMQQIQRDMMSGRLICDIKISAKELIKSRSYDLTELVDVLLHKKRVEVSSDEISNSFSSSIKLMQLVKSAMLDTEYILTLMCELNVLPLALQITNIAGNLLGRTLLGGRSERNEFLLLHAFHAKNFICPDKVYKYNKLNENEEEDIGNNLSTKDKTGKKKSSYLGGLVLDPKKGFYDTYILLMDFNSLYPSIIQEYNICFTTIPQIAAGTEGEDEIPEIPDPSLDAGVLPTEIRKLVESRRQVKQMMKSQDLALDLKMQYNIRQQALKLTANSMYGCLGFTHSRFYAKPLAALVTSRGREILLHTKDLVQSMNLDVIYGDTDSIMINTHSTDLNEVFKLGNKVKIEINKAYTCIEIDIDGVFKSMLLLKKKKYAALTIEQTANGQLKTSKEIKGLDIVRRDWSQLAKDTGEYVVDEILSDKLREAIIENIQSHLINLAATIDKIPVSKFSITKQLTKDPAEYPDKKSLPHVLVALRLNQKAGKKLRKGDTVTYIICEDGNKVAATQRAYHIDELEKDPKLKIDFKYYLSQQIHPVVSRVCDPIDGADPAAIAEFLGLDPSGYRKAYGHENDESTSVSNQISDEERFRDCARFKFNCSDCNKNIEIDSAFIGSNSAIQSSFAHCTNVECKSSPGISYKMLCNKLVQQIRYHNNKYYQV